MIAESGETIRASSTKSEDLAYKFHPGKIPLIDMTVGRLIARAAEHWPNREAFVSIPQGIRITYKQLLKRTDQIAAGLKKLGLKQGDRVGICGPNDLEWYLSFLATSRAGFVAVGINPAYQQAEFDYCISKVGISAVIAPPKFKHNDYASILLQSRKTNPSLDHVILWSENHIP